MLFIIERLARDLNFLYSTCIKSSVILLFNQIAPLILISILTRLIISKRNFTISLFFLFELKSDSDFVHVVNLNLFTANLLNTVLSVVYLIKYHANLSLLVFFYSIWFLANLILCILALQSSSQSMRRNQALISFILLLILNETLMNQVINAPESIRGITIITQMKYLSYMLHLNDSWPQSITFSFILSELISFSSYIWSINSTVFGPWINFRIHLNAMLRSFKILVLQESK